MISLLPLQQKEELRQGKKLKLVLTLGFLTLTFFVCLFLTLFAVRVYLLGEVAAEKILLAQKEEEGKSPQIQTLEENINAFNETLVKLDALYQNQPDLTQILETISETLPAGVYLTSLSLSPKTVGKEKKVMSNLAGFSPTRQALLDLKSNLEKVESFSAISFLRPVFKKSSSRVSSSSFSFVRYSFSAAIELVCS